MKSSDAQATSATFTPSDVCTEHSVITSPRLVCRSSAITILDWVRPCLLEAGLIRICPNLLSSTLNGRFLNSGLSMTLAQSMALSLPKETGTARSVMLPNRLQSGLEMQLTATRTLRFSRSISSGLSTTMTVATSPSGQMAIYRLGPRFSRWPVAIRPSGFLDGRPVRMLGLSPMARLEAART